MNYILLYIALGGLPSYLGTYQSEHLCNQAIREIYEAQVIPQGIPLTVQERERLKSVVDLQLKFQTNFRCVVQKIT